MRCLPVFFRNFSVAKEALGGGAGIKCAKRQRGKDPDPPPKKKKKLMVFIFQRPVKLEKAVYRPFQRKDNSSQRETNAFHPATKVLHGCQRVNWVQIFRTKTSGQ